MAAPGPVRRHAAFVAQLLAAAVVPFLYGRNIAFAEVQYLALVLVHQLLVSVRDVSGSPSVQADVRHALEEALASGRGSADDARRRHYAQSVRYLLMYALVLAAFTAAETAVASVALSVLGRLLAVAWVVHAARDTAGMWRLLREYRRASRRHGVRDAGRAL